MNKPNQKRKIIGLMFLIGLYLFSIGSYQIHSNNAFLPHTATISGADDSLTGWTTENTISHEITSIGGRNNVYHIYGSGSGGSTNIQDITGTTWIKLECKLYMGDSSYSGSRAHLILQDSVNSKVLLNFRFEYSSVNTYGDLREYDDVVTTKTVSGTINSGTWYDITLEWKSSQFLRISIDGSSAYYRSSSIPSGLATTIGVWKYEADAYFDDMEWTDINLQEGDGGGDPTGPDPIDSDPSNPYPDNPNTWLFIIGGVIIVGIIAGVIIVSMKKTSASSSLTQYHPPSPQQPQHVSLVMVSMSVKPDEAKLSKKPRICPNCGVIANPDDQFCNSCGYDIGN